MQSIWAFLLQTLSVSLVAALLLAVKALLRDLLPPRWQYGVWGLLALRILVPASLSATLAPRLLLWLETAKAVTERTLGSAYAAAYTPITVYAPVPLPLSAPRSITDWLFVLYVAGVALTLVWYLVCYIRLRLLLRRAAPAPAQVGARVAAVGDAYGLRGCRTVCVAGLPSAFVCGVLRPVLVLPDGPAPDDKIILHELLHLRHRDAAQSVIWCILRALHWCNPFLQVVFNRIGNDLESLCDQRVLERLEGEQRRDYGAILLDMANERYPRAPGTSSISNGGRNIARRIAAIAHFKRYPRGMALVCACMVLVLCVPTLTGVAASYRADDYRPGGEAALERALALTRIRRCTTVAGALDTYAKGLLLENGIYLATASPLDRQEALCAQMLRNSYSGERGSYHLDPGEELRYIVREGGYEVLNLRRCADDRYEALLLFSVSTPPDARGNSVYRGGSVCIPVTVTHRDGWEVTESGARLAYPDTPTDQLVYLSNGAPALKRFEKTGATGTVTAAFLTQHSVENTVQSGGWSIFGSTGFDESPKPDAAFDYVSYHKYVEYRFGGSDAERAALSTVGMRVTTLDRTDEDPAFSDDYHPGNSAWSSSDGSSGTNQEVTGDWDGTLSSGGGGGYGGRDAERALNTPAGFAVQIVWDGVAVEDFILTEVDT